MFNFFDYHLDGTLEVPYNLSPTRFIKSWNIIINGLCVYPFELVFGPLSLSIGFTILGASLMGYVYMHLSFYVPN